MKFLPPFEDTEDSLDKEVSDCGEMGSSKSISDTKDSILDFLDDNLPNISSFIEQLQEEIEK